MPDINNMAAAELLASRLPEGLDHPGDTAADRPAFKVQMPGMRSTGMPNEMQAEFAQEAGLPSNDAPLIFGVAIVNTLEQAGYTITRTAELDELKAEAAEAPSKARIVKVFDRTDSTRKQPLLELTVTNRDFVTIDTRLLRQVLNQDDEQ